MKRLILASFLIIGASSAHAAIALVQSTGSYATGSEGVSRSTFNAAPTVGNLQIAYCTASNATAITMSGWNVGPSGNGGSGASQRSGRIFWRIVVATHPAWAQIDTGGNAARIMEMAEFSGIDTTAALLAEGAGITASGTSHATPSVTPGDGVNALVVAGYMVRAAGAWSGAELTGSIASTEMEDRFVSTLNQSSIYYNDIASTSGNYAGTGTTSASDVGTASIAIFKAAGGAPPADVPAQEQFNRVPDPIIIGL